MQPHSEGSPARGSPANRPGRCPHRVPTQVKNKFNLGEPQFGIRGVRPVAELGLDHLDPEQRRHLKAALTEARHSIPQQITDGSRVVDLKYGAELVK